MSGLMNLIKSGIAQLGKSGKAQDGKTTLTRDAILATDVTNFSPTNSGDWGVYNSVPTVQSCQYVDSVDSANRLTEKAEELTIKAEASVKAYRALRKIKTADVVVQTAHNKYKADNAKKTLEQVQSNHQTAKVINGLRSNYARSYTDVAHQIRKEDSKVAAIVGLESDPNLFKI
jgi:hypothetical protein